MAENRLPTNRITRAVKPAAMAASMGLRHANDWARSMGESDAQRAKRQLRQAIKSAEQVAELMGDMKGAFMKIGQLLSFADMSMLPAEVRNILASLQADAPPMAYDLVADVVESELGRPPADAFDWFSPMPIAAASIGQVHAARLGDDEVVVKVQYPGVADAVAADLNNAGLMAMVAGMMQPFVRQYLGRLDVKDLMDEVRDRVLEELDYIGEAENQRAFGRVYAGHPSIRVPDVVDERSTARVLTSAYHDGMRFQAAAQASKKLRDTWGEAVARFGFGSVYRHGLANADPHPGNYLFHEDGTVTFLDFGCIKRFTPTQVERIADIGRAALADDATQYVDAMVAAGFLPGVKPEMHGALYQAMRGSYLPIYDEQPWRYTSSRGRLLVATHMGMTEAYHSFAPGFDLPPDYLFLGRVTLGTHSVLAGLRAEGMWRALFEELWCDAEPVTDMGRAEQQWRSGQT